MGNDTQNNQPETNNVGTISANSQIIFTVKSFFATIGSILGLFVAFYFTVFVPRADKTEEYQKQLYQQQQVYISGELTEIKQSIDNNTKAIGINTTAIRATNDRFKDLNRSVESIANSNGGFGNVTASIH